MHVGDHRRDLSTLTDVLVALLAYLAVLNWHVGGIDALNGWYAELVPCIVGTWWVASITLRRDVPYRLGGTGAEIRETVAVNAIGAVVIVCLSLLTKHLAVSRLVLAGFPVLSGVFSASIRLVARGLLGWWRRQGHDVRQVLVLGPVAASVRMVSALLSPDAGLRAVGLLVPDGDTDGAEPWLPVLGHYADLADVLHDRVVDQLAVTAPLDDPGLRTVVQTAIREGKTVWLVLDAFGALLMGRSTAGQVVVLSPQRNSYDLGLKRTLDVVVSTLALLVASPIMAACALAIKAEHPTAPVVFRQRRVGLHGRQFTCFKFRSMVPDAERRRETLLARNEMNGPVFKIRDDPRITRVGRVLRKFSLDELPQLWNVLRGDMSLVGPRPPLPDEVREYQPDFRRRLAFRPGLTCLWQVSGRNAIDFERWMQLDLQYVDNWSLGLDLVILLKTIPAVLFGSGM